MKKIVKMLGTCLLGISTLVAVIGPASLSGMAIEDMPQSIKAKR